MKAINLRLACIEHVVCYFSSLQQHRTSRVPIMWRSVYSMHYFPTLSLSICLVFCFSRRNPHLWELFALFLRKFLFNKHRLGSVLSWKFRPVDSCIFRPLNFTFTIAIQPNWLEILEHNWKHLRLITNLRVLETFIFMRCAFISIITTPKMTSIQYKWIRLPKIFHVIH